MSKKKLVNEAAVALFAREMFLKRNASGLSQKEFGDLIGMSAQQIGAVERQERMPTRQFAQLLDEKLGANGHFTELWSATKLLGHRRSLPKYVELERRAQNIRQFQPQVMPALLQTEDYAAEVLRAAFPPKPYSEVDELLAARMARQKVLDRDQSPLVEYVIDEAALRRVVGGPDVMRAQWDQIIERSQEPFVTVQVLPFDQGAHAALEGAFTILGLSPVESVMYLENAEGGQVYSDPQLVLNATGRFNSLMAGASHPQRVRTSWSEKGTGREHARRVPQVLLQRELGRVRGSTGRGQHTRS
ncbi:helix-turn-helix transcriptional regulator [Nocardiopsis sp. CNR-923]|uniref:helix-turn-helix domain-containing protein n=1 Tax=Nocardiopsis sp. CNR-923 TaxID=1904965 RepID=UPI00096A70A2|nr:helix-turn-helix transcriptional regulator [Nocardiopsis sp. CNR-923]